MQVPTQLILRGLISGTALVSLCGCGSDSAPKAASAERVASAPASHGDALAPVIASLELSAAPAGEQTVADEMPANENREKTSQTVAADYQPPFPDRVNLFVAPKRERNNMLSNQDDGESVQLLGFVNVVGHRVVLSIDGVVFPVAEGDTEAGIEVISIQPPMVVLQRGRERWQAALDN